MKKTGTVFHVQHFSLDDGPGIRTTVFLKGCPLDCVWCHNPESKASVPELSFAADHCLRCGKCVSVCPEAAHTIENGIHMIDRTVCRKCGQCTDVCIKRALTLIGRECSADEIMEDVQKDAVFFGEDGGLTLSGGEPLLQYDFSLELLKRAKEKGIHTAVETCGYTTRGLEEISPYVDLWLYDIKILESDRHKRYTGVTNERILMNLRCLDDLGEKIVLRCPIIPDINMRETHFAKLTALAGTLKNAASIELEPYHPLGIAKSEQLGRIPRYDNRKFLDRDELTAYAEEMKKKLDIPVISSRTTGR